MHKLCLQHKKGCQQLCNPWALSNFVSSLSKDVLLYLNVANKEANKKCKAPVLANKGYVSNYSR